VVSLVRPFSFTALAINKCDVSDFLRHNGSLAVETLETSVSSALTGDTSGTHLGSF